MKTDLGNALDGQSLARLRMQSGEPSRDTARAVAKQFESLFVQTMLKSMRSAGSGDALWGGKGEEQYRDLFDQQLSLEVASGQGIGLAPIIERQLLTNMGFAEEQGPALDRSLDRYAQRVPSQAPPQTPASAASAAANAKPVEALQEAAAPAVKAPVFEKPVEFVQAVWRAAEHTAERLGVSPKALVAQAALETGWGRHVIGRGEESSFNLFGIKAHRDWDGDTVKVQTLEYRDGVPRRELASFRSYGSLEESFEDYANFLQSHPRYKNALAVAGDPEAYVRALQDAGYATDPHYAEKISRIMNGNTLSGALAGGG